MGMDEHDSLLAAFDAYKEDRRRPPGPGPCFQAGWESGRDWQRQQGSPPPLPPAADTFVLSIAGGPMSFRVELPLLLTETQWVQLTGMLNAVVKPTLVASPAATVGPQRIEAAYRQSVALDGQTDERRAGTAE